jgi:hypothetical protein
MFGGAVFHLAENDDSVVVGLVAVVQDEVLARGVVPDVVDCGIRSAWLALQ